MIHHFLEDKPDIEVVSERIDDGDSGVNFDRRAVKKMIADAEKGVINCIVVKDLSRFGRNFVEVGKYIDQVFPALGIRVISINENFDSINGLKVYLLPICTIKQKVRIKRGGGN